MLNKNCVFLCFGLCLVFGRLCFCCAQTALILLCFGLRSSSITAQQQLTQFSGGLCSGLCLVFGRLCFSCAQQKLCFFVLWFVLGVWEIVLLLCSNSFDFVVLWFALLFNYRTTATYTIFWGVVLWFVLGVWEIVLFLVLKKIVFCFCFGLCVVFGRLCFSFVPRQFFLCFAACLLFGRVSFLVLKKLCFFGPLKSAVRRAAKQHN